MTPFDELAPRDLALRLPAFAALASEKARELSADQADTRRGRPAESDGISERVIRDYVRRRILSPTYRDPETGRGGIYGYRHLIELLAARTLLADGWPLDLIGEALRGKSDPEIEAMLPIAASGNKALSLARMFQSMDQKGVASARKPSRAMAMLAKDVPPPFPGKPAFSAVNDRLAKRAMLKADLPWLLERIAGRPGIPSARHLVAILLADDLILLVGQERLATLSVEDAEEIGRAVAAALIAAPTTPTPTGPKE